MGLFQWGCADWLAFYVLIIMAVGTFKITKGIFYALLIATLGYEVDMAPANLTTWSVALTVVFWLGVFTVRGWVSVRKINREKATLLGSEPSALSPADFERFVALWLEKNGYREVEVVGKSGDYGADVLATDPSGVRIAVQCKRYRGSTGIRAAQEVLAACSYYDCGCGMVFTTGHFTRQAIEFARKSGILLYVWDGNIFVKV